MAFPAQVSVEDLDGSSGFRLDGVAFGDQAGADVAGIGDVNGDGLADVLVSARDADSGDVLGGGTAYVVFGSTAGFDANFDLANLDGSNGFRIDGDIPYSTIGLDVSSAGDVNGDGVDDLMLSGSGGDGDVRYPGVTYVIYGSTDSFAASIGTSSLDGSNGFAIVGADDFADGGHELSSIGDLNGDGYDDLLIAGGSDDAAAFVIYGSAEAPAAELSLADIDGSNGFAITGPSAGTRLGWDVAGIGDFNRDGYDDFVVGAPSYSPDFRSQAGSAFVVFGAADGFGDAFELSTLDGDNGFRIDGAAVQDLLGTTVSAAGDVNGDGYADFIVSATGADPHSHARAGEAYVVFGRAGNFYQGFDVDDLNGSNGFAIRGDLYGQGLGTEVSAAGDLNGDGFDDVVVSLNWNVDAPGTSYVIFGKPKYYTPGIDVTALDGSNGFRIDGAPGDMMSDADGIGDFNGDGFDDLILGGWGALHEGVQDKGAAYILFGQKPTEAVTRIDGNANQTVHGGFGNDRLASWIGNDHLLGYEGNDTLASFKGRDILEGGEGNDTYFVVNDRDDTIIDSGGIDMIYAEIHWDLRGFAEIENLKLGGEGNWHMTGNGKDNVLSGSFGNNEMLGLEGDDTLSGWFGDDILVGGLGRDTLEGGVGADRFDFLDVSEVGSTAARDVILDFTVGEDLIHLGLIDADATHSGNQAFVFADAFSGAAGELIAREDAGNTIVEADLDGDGVADFQLELRGQLMLTPGDFIL
jgi:Ca2+-binding RTX toxin-like protein